MAVLRKLRAKSPYLSAPSLYKVVRIDCGAAGEGSRRALLLFVMQIAALPSFQNQSVCSYTRVGSLGRSFEGMGREEVE